MRSECGRFAVCMPMSSRESTVAFLCSRYASTVGAAHIYTSAKQNKGLQEAFEDLTQRMIKRRKEKRSSAEPSPMAPNMGAGAGSGKGRQQGKIVIVDDTAGPAPTQQQRKCC